MNNQGHGFVFIGVGAYRSGIRLRILMLRMVHL